MIGAALYLERWRLARRLAGNVKFPQNLSGGTPALPATAFNSQG